MVTYDRESEISDKHLKINGLMLSRTLMKLLKEHLGQRVIPLLPDDVDDRLDAVASISEAGERITVSLVNIDLLEEKTVRLALPQGDWRVERADVLTAADVHDANSFDAPQRVCDAPFAAGEELRLPPHSLVRICFVK